jgi:GT2 family glycosyltransferase
MDLSVIIPNWNGAAVLADCVGEVLVELATSGLSHEVLVVDDASSDGSAQALAHRFPQVRVVLNARNNGFAFTVNAGIRRSSGDYLLLLNNDAKPQPGAIRRVWSYLRENKDVGAAGCRIIGGDGSLQRSCRDFPSLTNLVFKRVIAAMPSWLRGNAERGAEFWAHDSIRRVDWMHMVFLMVSRGALRKIGNLDERFFMYGEDTDFGWRLKRAGLGLVFLPDVDVVHIESFSGNQRWGRQALVKRQLGMHTVLRKYYSSYYVLAYRALMILLQTARLARLGIRAAAGRPSETLEIERQITSLMLRVNLRPR